jgi:hypothetical protein
MIVSELLMSFATSTVAIASPVRMFPPDPPFPPLPPEPAAAEPVVAAAEPPDPPLPATPPTEVFPPEFALTVATLVTVELFALVTVIDAASAVPEVMRISAVAVIPESSLYMVNVCLGLTAP